MRRSVALFMVMLAAVLTAGVTAGTASPRYVVLQVPGYEQTIPYGVNERGDVVGGAIDASFAFHGFLYRDGEYSIIDVPGATTTIPTAINERGVVVGYFYAPDGTLGAFTFWRGEHQIISVPGIDLVPQGINNRGDIIGWIPDSQYRSFLLTKRGEFTTFDHSDEVISLQAWGINSSGVVVGGAYNQTLGRFSSFVFRDGEVQFPAEFLDLLVNGINDRGDVLAEIPAESGFAIFRKGVRLTLDHPEPQYGISDLSNNWIVGSLPGGQGYLLRMP